MVVGFDFSFSYPAWFLEELGFAVGSGVLAQCGGWAGRAVAASGVRGWEVLG